MARSYKRLQWPPTKRESHCAAVAFWLALVCLKMSPRGALLPQGLTLIDVAAASGSAHFPVSKQAWRPSQLPEPTGGARILQGLLRQNVAESSPEYVRPTGSYHASWRWTGVPRMTQVWAASEPSIPPSLLPATCQRPVRWGTRRAVAEGQLSCAPTSCHSALGPCRGQRQRRQPSLSCSGLTGFQAHQVQRVGHQ